MSFEFCGWLAEKVFSNQGREVAFSAIIAVTAPSILEKVCVRLCGIFYTPHAPLLPSRHMVQGIKVHIVQNVQKVRIRVDAYLFCPTLKEIAAPVVSFIKILRIPDIQFSNEQRNAVLYALGKKQVIVIFHQTPPMNINNRIFSITTYEVVMVFFKEVGRIVRWSGIVKYAETVDETEPISVVEKNISLFDTPVE